MKKTISTFLMVCALFMPLMATTAAGDVLPGAKALVEGTEFKPCPRGTYRVRKHTKKGTKIRNSIIAGGVGLVIGAVAGGKRGALIGAGAGAGGYLVYRYVKDRHGKCVVRYVKG